MRALALPLLTAFVTSAAIVPACRAISRRAGLTAHPREDRWHRREVALFGGAAIVLAFLLGAAAFGVA